MVLVRDQSPENDPLAMPLLREQVSVSTRPPRPQSLSHRPSPPDGDQITTNRVPVTRKSTISFSLFLELSQFCQIENSHATHRIGKKTVPEFRTHVKL